MGLTGVAAQVPRDLPSSFFGKAAERAREALSSFGLCTMSIPSTGLRDQDDVALVYNSVFGAGSERRMRTERGSAASGESPSLGRSLTVSIPRSRKCSTN